MNSIKGNKKPLLAVLSGMILFIVIFNVYRGNASSEELAVKTAVVGQVMTDQLLFASGSLNTVREQEIRAEIGGVIQEIRVIAGDPVKPGQVLAALNDLEMRQSRAEAAAKLADARERDALRREELLKMEAIVRQAEINLEQVRLEAQRTESLYTGEAVSQKELDEARHDLAVAEVEYDTALKQLELKQEEGAGQAVVQDAEAQIGLADKRLEACTLRAAISGTVLTVQVKQGMSVTPGTLLLTIGSTGELEAEAEISESDIGRVRTGQEVEVWRDADASFRHKGRVTAIAPVAEQSEQGRQKVIRVTVALDGDAVGLSPGMSGLSPGMSVQMNIKLGQQEVLGVPVAALAIREGKSGVFIVEEGLARFLSLEAAAGDQDYIEVAGVLQEGQKVVLDPPDHLKNGMAVIE